MNPITYFSLTDMGDGCARYERADGYAIDWWAIPPAGGSMAVLIDPAGAVVDYYGNPEDAASAAPEVQS